MEKLHYRIGVLFTSPELTIVREGMPGVRSFKRNAIVYLLLGIAMYANVIGGNLETVLLSHLQKINRITVTTCAWRVSV